MTEQNLPEGHVLPENKPVEESLATEIEQTAKLLENSAVEMLQGGRKTDEIQLDAKPGFTPQDVKVFVVPWGCLIKGIVTHDAREPVLSATWLFNERMGMTSVQTPARGTLIPYPGNAVTGGELVKFFAPDTRAKRSQVTATLRGMHGVYDAFFENEIRVTFPVVRWSRFAWGATSIVKEGDKLYVQFGSVRGEFNPGFMIGFNVGLTNANDNGQIGIMQFMKGGITYYKSNGDIVNISTGEDWYLDKYKDVDSIFYGRQGPKNVRYGTDTFVAMDDSPFLQLHPKVMKILFQYSFRTFLVYKNEASDARWVPLWVLPWTWKGELDKGRSSNPWPTSFTVPPVVTRGDLQPVDALPEWTHQTCELVERLNKEVAEGFAGDMQPVEWKRPTRPAKQMVIVTDLPMTAEQKTAISSIVGCAVSKMPYGPNTVLVWASPDAAREAKKVKGVITIEELSATARYMTKPAKATDEKDYIIFVAPFILYNNSDASMHLAMITSPKSLEEVGQDLLNMLRSRGVNNATISMRSFSMLNLSFPSPVTDENLLRYLATHEQVNFVERKSAHFTDDDPKPPIS
jgi:hypothetical protein